MKLLHKNISSKNGEGEVKLSAEEPEDMWHVYNLICEGDRVRSTTIRKVVKEGATGSVSSERRRTIITIEVTSIDFDPIECCIRLNGRNVEENDFIKMGAFHTIELEQSRPFSIHKHCWDTIFLERLDASVDVTKKATSAAVVMQQGLALLCLITGHMTVVRAKIEHAIPKKRSGNSGHEKAMKKFFETILASIQRHIDFEIVNVVVLASPGYVKDDFYKFMLEEAVRLDLKNILNNKDMFLLCHSSSGHKHALQEVLAQEDIQKRLADTKAASDVKCLERFFDTMHSSPESAYYGFRHVQMANEAQAIDSLMVTDGLFRAADLATRKKYVELVESCRENGCDVHIFSSQHESGEQLEQFSGVAAILRFPLPDLELQEEYEAEQAAAAAAAATVEG